MTSSSLRQRSRPTAAPLAERPGSLDGIGPRRLAAFRRPAGARVWASSNIGRPARATSQIPTAASNSWLGQAADKAKLPAATYFPRLPMVSTVAVLGDG